MSGDSLAALTDCKLYFKYPKLCILVLVLFPYFKLLLVDLKIVKGKKTIRHLISDNSEISYIFCCFSAHISDTL